MQGVLDDRDQEIRHQLIDAWDDNDGKIPKVGSYVKFADGSYWRISHDWSDFFQYSLGGSFFLHSSGHASFSGSLESPISYEPLTELEEFRLARFWFFSHNSAGAGRGVDCEFMIRVFKYEDRSVTPAIDRLKRTYTATQLYREDDQRSRGGYQYLIEKGGMSFKAFRTTTEFYDWMRIQGLEITDVTYENPGEVRCMNVGPKGLYQALYEFNALRDREVLG